MSDTSFKNPTAGAKSRNSGRNNWQQQQQQQQPQVRQTSRSGGSNNEYLDRLQQRSKRTTGGGTNPSRSESRGHVVAVLENFGFIQSVDRMEDVFFHFAELMENEKDSTAAASGPPIKVGDKVGFEFKTSRDMKEKAAKVHILPPGTTLPWDDAVDDDEVIVYQGLIDKLPTGNSTKSYNVAAELLQSCGTIVLNTENTSINRFGNEAVYFTFGDYCNNNNKMKNPSNNTSRRGNSGNNDKGDSQLSIRDFVEFHLVRNRRTKALFARKIALIQSEKDRIAAAKEEMLLKSSTREKGVVMALRRNGGYLRSTNHDVPIYFSYEHVILPPNDSEECDNDYTLREGSFVNFLVVYEKVSLDDDFATTGANSTLNEGKSTDWSTVSIRLSARQVEEIVPAIGKEDIKSDRFLTFYEILRCRVQGTVVSLPSFAPHVYIQNLPLNDTDLRGSYGIPGKIRLHQNIITDCCINGEQTSSTIEFVEFYPEDAPGGYRIISSYVGSNSKEQQNLQEQDNLWVCVGDCVLLDIVCESFTYQSKLSDNLGSGSYNIKTLPWTRFRAHPPLLPDGKRATTLLIERFTPAGRFEGVILALKKEAGYGFIKLMHRNVDVYFRTSDVMPTELLPDGVNDNFQGQLKIGAGVSFELSVSSTMQQDENLRCKRIIVWSVPNESTSKAPLDSLSNSWYFSHAYHCLRKDVQALVNKRHTNGGGTLEICYGKKGDKAVEEYAPNPQAQSPDVEEKICGMTPFERYPGVASLLDSLSAGLLPRSEITFPWILPQIETAVIVNMAETYGAIADFVDAEGNTLAEGGVNALDWPGSGRIHIQMEIVKDGGRTMQAEIISEVGTSTKLTGVKADPAVKKPIKKAKPSKPISLVRFDKSAATVPDGYTFQEGDLVVCDVYQCRPTGNFEAYNLRLLQKAKKENKTAESFECVGFVHEIMPARQFGFITWIETEQVTNTAVVKEKVFFHLNDASAASNGESTLQKGDEVKFLIGNTKAKATPGTKKVAVNIERLTPGTLPKLTFASHERNLCQGYVLIEPSHTKLNLIAPKKKSKGIDCAPSSVNRWQNVDLDKDIPVDKSPKKNSSIEDGRILLLNHPKGQFCTGKLERKDNEEINENRNGTVCDANDSHLGKIETSSSLPAMQEAPATSRHVSYNKAAILISAGQDSDTPRRGDLVVFSQSSKGVGKGVRVIQKNAAQLIRGNLTQINLIDGTAVFIEENLLDKNENVKGFLFPLSEIVSCQPNMLKDLERVEGILYESNIYGVCRTSDLYLSTVTLSSDKAQRPRLNLTVKKEMESSGGKTFAKSNMAKGPDYTTRGFANGWTSRKSMFTTY